MNVRYPPSERQILVHANDRFWPISGVQNLAVLIGMSIKDKFSGVPAYNPCEAKNGIVYLIVYL